MSFIDMSRAKKIGDRQQAGSTTPRNGGDRPQGDSKGEGAAGP